MNGTTANIQRRPTPLQEELGSSQPSAGYDLDVRMVKPWEVSMLGLGDPRKPNYQVSNSTLYFLVEVEFYFLNPNMSTLCFLTHVQ